MTQNASNNGVSKGLSRQIDGKVHHHSSRSPNPGNWSRWHLVVVVAIDHDAHLAATVREGSPVTVSSHSVSAVREGP